MATQFEKTDKTCNNIYLIDERLCLSDSFDIINFNFNNLSNNVEYLIDYANQFNDLYTHFAQNSANWNTGSVQTNSKSKLYNSAYSCVYSLSSSWNKEFSVIYPFILEINDYYTNKTSYLEDIKSWLTLNFDPNDYAINQEVLIYLNLYQIDTFTFSFSGKYEEKCITIPPPKTVCCSGNNCGDLHQGCNISLGNGQKTCINAYSRCGTRVTTSCARAACPSSGGKMLNLLQVSNTYNDTYTARCVSFKYKKQNDVEWTLIS